ncbi:argininosuccinate lyase [Cereibacter sediminicola]|nr:argininosuccinate lyase [Cereibacter sediminicola]
MRAPLILLVLALAGCGIDGPPLRPGTDQPVEVQPGLTIGGTAEFGIRSN